MISISLQKHLYPAVERRWLESIDPNHASRDWSRYLFKTLGIV